jgi:hypothetical protein
MALPSRPSKRRQPDSSKIKRNSGRGTALFAAFISYNRAVDGSLAHALQGALQRFAKPWYRRRALRLFRDDTNLSANPNLWSSVEAALSDSEFLILLASPGLAKSKWVDREVSYWLTHRPTERLLLAITEGIPPNERAGKLDWKEIVVSLLPPALRHHYTEPPRYTDLRWANHGDQLSLSNPRFQECIADLAATLHHRPKDDLVGEEVRQHRRTIRIIRITIAVLSIFALTAATAAVIAIDQRQTALLQRDVATSRQLAAEADLRSNSDPQLAALLSVTALQVHDTSEARTSIVHQLDRLRPIRGFLNGQDGPIRNVLFSPDGATVASVGRLHDEVSLWDVSSQAPRARLSLSEGPAGSMAFRTRREIT